MIRKSVQRFSEKIMRKQESRRPGAVSRARTVASGSMHGLFRRRDPGDHGFGETIDLGPGAVTDAVLVGGDVDHGAASLRIGDLVVALLVGEDDQAIALAVDLAHRLAEEGRGMRLRVDDRKAVLDVCA